MSAAAEQKIKPFDNHVMMPKNNRSDEIATSVACFAGISTFSAALAAPSVGLVLAVRPLASLTLRPVRASLSTRL